MKLFFSFFIALHVFAGNCFANDTTGAVGAGGIEFKKTDEISMEKEVLTISADLVRVEYEFVNKTNHPIKERIFFPMPFYDADRCSPGYFGPIENFQVWVNGKKVNTLWSARARLRSGEDVTERLKNYGLTDKEIVEFHGETVPCGNDADDDVMANTARKSTLDWVKLAKEGVTKLWQASYVYYWDQEFPPAKTIHVAHEYFPFAGRDSATIDFVDPQWGIKNAKALASRFYNYDLCITDGTYNAAKQAAKRSKLNTDHSVIEYVLTTGANWSGPIKDFTLNLKKGSKDAVVSLCFDGDFVKSDALTLSSHVRNFVPKKDLQILFLYPQK
jgi:hypothetical protein